MWMLAREPKMNFCIFGFQRWVWWPKWAPLSSSWRMLKSGRAMCRPFLFPVGLRRRAAPRGTPEAGTRTRPHVCVCDET